MEFKIGDKAIFRCDVSYFEHLNGQECVIEAVDTDDAELPYHAAFEGGGLIWSRVHWLYSLPAAAASEPAEQPAPECPAIASSQDMANPEVTVVSNAPAFAKTKPRKPPQKPPRHYLLQFFEYTHLPEHLRLVSAPFGDLATIIDGELPDNPEKTTALRKLLEAKDCAVRAKLFKAGT